MFFKTKKIDANRQKNMIRSTFKLTLNKTQHMSTLLEKQIKVNRIVTTSIISRAIEDPSRAKIIEILYHKSMNAEQIANQLKKIWVQKST